MLVLKDVPSLSRVTDAALREILETRAQEVEPYLDGGDLDELVTYIVVEPGEPLDVVDAELGFPLLCDRIHGTRFGEPGFMPCFELIADHPAWYEIVFILSDGGEGVEVLVPKHPDVDPELLQMCTRYALPLPD